MPKPDAAELLNMTREALAEDDDHMVAAEDGLPWLMAQLSNWPTRVDEDKTTNLRFLMMSAAATLKAMSERRISIVANVSGGVLQGASANVPNVEIYALDFEDVPDDPNNIILDGKQVSMGETSCDLDPDFVRSVIDAPTRDEENEG